MAHRGADSAALARPLFGAHAHGSAVDSRRRGIALAARWPPSAPCQARASGFGRFVLDPERPSAEPGGRCLGPHRRHAGSVLAGESPVAGVLTSAGWEIAA